jgi:hypothetical protein
MNQTNKIYKILTIGKKKKKKKKKKEDLSTNQITKRLSQAPRRSRSCYKMGTRLAHVISPRQV